MRPTANRGIIEQLMAKETLAKVLDGIFFHDQNEEKAFAAGYWILVIPVLLVA